MFLQIIQPVYYTENGSTPMKQLVHDDRLFNRKNPHVTPSVTPPPASFIFLIILAIFSLPAGAATFTVTNLNDSGAGSLRQMILNADAAAGADTIVFQTGLETVENLLSSKSNSY
jgi:hypothetical protein